MDPYSILQGRPYGGCAILWPNNLNLKVTPIISNCKRLCVVSIANVMLCNLYIPSSCANHSDSSLNIQKLTIQSLGSISQKDLAQT